MFKRALVAASVVAAFAVPAAAEVVVYGSLRAGVEAGRDSVLSRTTVIDQNSRIGFKGSDKIEGGAKLVFKAESSIRVDGSASTWGGRDTYIGIEDAKLGSIYVGKQLDAYADWTAPLNPVLDSAMINSEDLSFYGGSRLNKVVKYVSPAFSGVTVEASYDFGTKKAAQAAVAADPVNFVPAVAAKPAYNNTSASVLLSWTNDKITAGAAFSQENDAGTVADDKKTMAVVGAGVKMGDLTVSGNIETMKWDLADKKQNNANVGVSYAAGKYTYNALVARLFESDTAGTKGKDGATQLNLGVRYALSKQSTAFVNYTMLKNDENGGTTTATGYGGVADKTAHVVAVSLRTDF